MSLAHWPNRRFISLVTPPGVSPLASYGPTKTLIGNLEIDSEVHKLFLLWLLVYTFAFKGFLGMYLGPK